MTNVNPLINLRNSAIVWISVALVSLVGIWWVLGFFGEKNSPIVQQIEELKTTLALIQTEGVVTTKKWDELSAEERKNERWNTMSMLSPLFRRLVGTGTEVGKNIAIMKNISNKIGNGNYISWLEKSWTSEAESDLTKTQTDIAEIIPIFAGVAELESTQNIIGKITLKTLNNYIQTNIVEKFGLVNAFGQIGINQVKFSKEAPEIGLYDIPLKFERVPNENVINLLQFLNKTGGAKITETGKTVVINHIAPLTSKVDDGQSSLKNLLITVKEMKVSPTPIKTENQETRSVNIVTQSRALWDIDITLQFYIRGVSSDYIAILDKSIGDALDPAGKNSLLSKSNALLKQCNGCTEAPQIRDIILLLNQAKAAYDSILQQERVPETTSTPVEILERRTELMTTISTLQKKITTIGSLISPST